MPAGGAEGIGYLEATGQGSLPLVRALTEAGAVLEATESMEIMAEALDWQRCLMQPLISPAAAGKLRGVVRRCQPPPLRVYRQRH